MPNEMPVTPETLRIVLVENDPDDLFFLERALVKGGFVGPLLHFHDGAEAVAYLETLPTPDTCLPDIILSDIKMPRMDGIDFLGWLREQPRLKNIPVIILTSSSETTDMKRTTRLGIFKFVTKQVQYEDVVSALNLFVMSLNHDLLKSHRPT